MTTTAPLGSRTVSRAGFGAMQLVPERGSRTVSRRTAVQVVRRAVELGVSHIDTAEFYGDGETNRILREALAPWPADVVVATKVGAVRDGAGTLVPAQRPAELRSQVQDNLRSLGVDRLDLVNLRRVDRAPGIVARGEQVVDLDDQLAELAALRDEGLVAQVGLSAVTQEQLHRALPSGVVAVQNLYNLLERDAEALLTACARAGVAWVPFFPVGSGFAGRERPVDHPVVRSVAVELELTPPAVCLAWLLAHDPHVLLIPGTSDTQHVEANLAVGEVQLPGQALARLDAI